MFRLSLRPGDWFVLLVSIILVVFLTLQSMGDRGGVPIVRIEGEDESWVYPLDADIEVEVEGPLGHTHIHIHDGAVWVSDSPCTQKVCIAAGQISAPGTFIACLPNMVLVRIEGRQEGEIDGLAF
jgi:hypothetical protein